MWKPALARRRVESLCDSRAAGDGEEGEMTKLVGEVGFEPTRRSRGTGS
jgi:hypothetical protein